MVAKQLLSASSNVSVFNYLPLGLQNSQIYLQRIFMESQVLIKLVPLISGESWTNTLYVGSTNYKWIPYRTTVLESFTLIQRLSWETNLLFKSDPCY